MLSLREKKPIASPVIPGKACSIVHEFVPALSGCLLLSCFLHEKMNDVEIKSMELFVRHFIKKGLNGSER